MRLFRSKSKRSTMNNNNNIESEFEAKCLYWNDDYIGKKNPYAQTMAEGVNDFIQDIKLAHEGCKCLSHTKIARRRRIRSQSGYYMAVLPNGKIVGTRNKCSIFTEVDVIPVGSNLVKIWGVEAGLFLMIDDAGQMRGTDVDSAECIFEETLTENFFNVYYSAMYLHKRWCINLQNKQNSRTFYNISKDSLFVTEVLSPRTSVSSSCYSSDESN